MLSVSPISSVHFGEGPIALDRAGAYAKANTDASAAPAAQQAKPEEKKSSGTGKKVLGTVAGLVVVAAALAALPKVFPKAIRRLNADELAAKPGFMKKVGHYVAVAGETIAKYTYEPIVNLFKKGKKAPASGTDAGAATQFVA